MYIKEYLQVFLCFFVSGVGIFFPYDTYRNNKNKFKAGRSYNWLSISNYGTFLVVISATVVVNFCVATEIPMMLNFDYENVSGKITYLEDEWKDTGKRGSSLYECYNMILELEDGIEVSKWTNSPVSVEEGDVVKCYKKSIWEKRMNIIAVNGKDVSDGYGKGWTCPGKSTFIPKVLFLIYLFWFFVFHFAMFYRKRKKYRQRLVRTYFIYGYDLEKRGHIVWMTGLICFGIISLIAIAGVGNNVILGFCMMIFMDIYALGYLMVFYGSCRGVAYEDGVFHVNYSNGWERRFSREEVTGIQNIKGEKYRICFRDEQGKDNEVRVTLHHKEQELILFPEKMSSGYY